jgi:hypothetical protein
MKILLCGTGLLACVLTCSAVETRFWQHDDQADFEKGHLDNLSLRSDGRLFLAPVFRDIFDSSTPYLWTVAADSKGNLYTGGGGSGNGAAKLFIVDPSGKSRVLTELDGLEIHALAVDRHDNIYAATDPDGKVYKIGRDGKAALFFDPKVKYIWALAFDSKDNLFVATGDQGEIYRIGPDGTGSIFFKTEETHARSLTIDAHDNLIAGTEPGGLVIRVTPAGEGFVLYQAPKREITAVAVAKDGAIYASGVGNKGAVAPVVLTPAPTPSPTPVTPGAITLSPSAPHAGPPPSLTGTIAPAIAGGSEVYRIAPDGAPRKVWSNSQDLVYALAFDSLGHPLLGTGNRGKIYRLDTDVLSTSLIDASPTQVTGFSSTAQGKLYAITGNIGRVYEIGPGAASSGTYESEVQDAGSFAYWGRLGFRGNVPTIAVSTRSGNLNRPQANWSPWLSIVRDTSDPVVCARCGGGRVASPSARFLQYKVELNSAHSKIAPELASVEIAYLPKNTAPLVEDIDITPPNYKFPAPSASAAASTSLTLPPMGQRKSSSTSSLELNAPQTLPYAKGWIGVRWAAADEDGDSLIYKVEIRGAGESEWRLLKDKIHEKYFGWDSNAFPDGEYLVRITASDAPSNPPDQALSSELISDPFLIDNTPPRILDLAAMPSGNRIEVHWKARDDRSNIDKAEYSVNGGDWLVVQPVTKLSDSPEEEYRLLVDRASPGEQVIAVRVSDEYDNQAAAKVVVK